MNKSILFVDDEKAILNSIRREFFDSSYEIYIATSGKEALEILSKKQINLIVSDMRMPEMDDYKISEVKCEEVISELIKRGNKDEQIKRTFC